MSVENVDRDLGSRYTATLFFDPTTAPCAAPAGMIGILPGTGPDRPAIFLKLDDGNTANWSKISPLTAIPCVYTVSPGGVGARFSTIQAAIDQAVLDGFSTASPAIVLISCGVYTENLVLKSGIHLLGMEQNLNSPSTVLDGVVAYTPDTGGVLHVTGIQFNPSVDPGVPVFDVFGGAGASKLEISGCEFLNHALNASALLRIDRISNQTIASKCFFTQNATGAAAILCDNSGELFLRDQCSIRSGGPALIFNGSFTGGFFTENIAVVATDGGTGAGIVQINTTTPHLASGKGSWTNSGGGALAHGFVATTAGPHTFVPLSVLWNLSGKICVGSVPGGYFLFEADQQAYFLAATHDLATVTHFPLPTLSVGV